MAQWLGVLTVLLDDLDSIPYSHGNSQLSVTPRSDTLTYTYI